MEALHLLSKQMRHHEAKCCLENLLRLENNAHLLTPQHLHTHHGTSPLKQQIHSALVRVRAPDTSTQPSRHVRESVHTNLCYEGTKRAQ
eukprot:scaffold52441_cov18-Tisochrysis_lutea.AAC.1